RLTCADMSYTFPVGTQLSGGGYLVVAAVPADIQSSYGVTNVMGPYTGSLKKAETLELLDEQGAVLLTVPYSNVYPWPVATDGTGHSDLWRRRSARVGHQRPGRRFAGADGCIHAQPAAQRGHQRNPAALGKC